MRLQAAVRYDNLFQREHSLGIQLQVSPQNTDEVKILAASYAVPLGLDQMSFSVTRSDSTVAAGAETTVLGKGTIWGLRRSIVMALTDTEYHVLNLGAEYKDFSNTVSSGKDGFSTPVHYLPLSAGYLAVLQDGQGRSIVSTSVGLALRGVASRDSQFDDNRSGANGGYSLLKFEFTREQKLPASWLLLGKLDGQLSADPLISNEQFVAGGVDSVRGYHEAAALGDQALHASLTVRSPSVAGSDAGWLSTLTFHGFVEAAVLEIHNPLALQQRTFHLWGTGIGLRAQSRRYGSLSVDLALPQADLGTTSRGDLRVHAAGLFEF
jgi:hemolysin activation/secretion protein